jgi:D-sedoheptulose 7-phosphate isomerase
MLNKIKYIINESINVKKSIYNNNKLIESIEKISYLIIDCFNRKGKVLLCGNGGSAADAQHIAAEFSGKFYFNRPPLFAEALHVNTSYITAVANDYSYDEIYSRIVQAMGREGDILIGMSTSGNSQNIINAFKTAKKSGMITIAFTGEKGGELKKNCDYLINVPSNDTPRIQESHIMIGHIICELVEEKLFKK